MDLHVARWGEQGAEVLLVHGSVMNGEMTWAEQRPLADRWRLAVVDRRGYFPNPPFDHEDFAEDAPMVAELLGEGMHLVGHSYGAVVSLLAAAERPEAVRSLTVVRQRDLRAGSHSRPRKGEGAARGGAHPACLGAASPLSSERRSESAAMDDRRRPHQRGSASTIWSRGTMHAMAGDHSSPAAETATTSVGRSAHGRTPERRDRPLSL